MNTENDTCSADCAADLDDAHRRMHNNNRSGGSTKDRGSPFERRALRIDISDASTCVCLVLDKTSLLICADPSAGTSFLYGYGLS